jgi:hypothetical protein
MIECQGFLMNRAPIIFLLQPGSPVGPQPLRLPFVFCKI